MKHCLLEFGVFLLLLCGGAIVNVSVAVAFAAYGKFPRVFLDPESYCKSEWALPRPIGFPPHATSMASGSAFGVDRTDMFAMTDTPSSLKASWRTYELMQNMEQTDDPEAQEWLDKQKLVLENTQEAETTAHFSMQSIASGVPMLALTGGRWQLRDFRRGGATQNGSLHAFDWSANQSQGTGATTPARMIPASPLWPGFAINTIFYAALLWLLWIAPGKIRRCIIVRGRIRGHRCPACGYQIAPGGGIGPVCSECGAALPAAWSTNAP
jgi:hypothetical protein